MRLALLAWLLIGCGGGVCTDLDLDGYGPGCMRGNDCDPDNASRNTNCELVGPPDCDADPAATGCRCVAGAVTTCLSTVDGIGTCHSGRAICLIGTATWGACQGGTGPSGEFCDEMDNDCDGLVDEGQRSPCGGCNSSCQGGVWGEGADPFVASDGLELTRFGELTLALRPHTTGALWAVNSAEGTVSKIDIVNAIEVARYPSGGSEPSRVAVDWANDAWVLNREFEGIPTATKIAGSIDRCRDRNGDRMIQTSSGPGDVRSIDEDECVLVHVPLGPDRSVARAIAIDGDRGLDNASGGDAWIGLHDGHEVVEIDGLDGHVITRVPTPGFSPYGATFDRWGMLWMIERDGLLARIDIRADPPEVELIEVPLPCYLLYGIAADPQGRLLVTGFSCDQLITYDPPTQRWDSRPSPPSPRAAAPAADGHIWVAHTGGQLSEVAFDPLRILRTVSLTSTMHPIETVGAAVDANGAAWGVSSQGATDGNGVATRIDPATGTVSAQVPIGAAPHVQGDLTGMQLGFEFVPEAGQAHVFEGCGADVMTEWLRVHVDADFGSSGEIEIEVRQAARREDLPSASFLSIGILPRDMGPLALSLPIGGAIEVRATLRARGSGGAPRLRRIGIEWRCPGPD